MQVDINHRGNGACPLCAKHDACRIRKAVMASMAFFPKRDSVMELVIYSCPNFKEKG
jgi:hypothetical protein